MLCYSRIPIRRSILTDLLVRNIELNFPYDFKRILGPMGFGELPTNLLPHQPLAELLRLYDVASLPDYKNAIERVPGINLTNMILNLPSIDRVAKDDVFWVIVDTLLEECNYSPLIEIQTNEIIKSIILRLFKYDDNIIKIKDSKNILIFDSTYIKIPKYDKNKLPMGYEFEIELWFILR